MSVRLRIELAPEDSADAPAAAAWVMSFYPNIEVVVESQEVVLGCSDGTRQWLATVWASGLCNEQLTRTQASFRAAVLDRLSA